MLLFRATLAVSCVYVVVGGGCPTTTPPTWPDRFVVVQRKIPDDDSGNSTTVTYYDWVAQANLIVITDDKDESNPLWDLELGSGQSYYFHRGIDCTPVTFPVGVLRKDWLSESEFLGERMYLGKKVLVWTKADFIDYYADAETCDPVSWYFHTMKARFDTVYYAPNATAPPHYFDPPEECFSSSLSSQS